MNPVTGVAVAGLGEVPTTGRVLTGLSDNLQLVGWLQQLQRFSAILLIRPVMHNLAEMQDELDKTALRRAVLAALRWKHE
jgi:hypothetical protein